MNVAKLDLAGVKSALQKCAYTPYKQKKHDIAYSFFLQASLNPLLDKLEENGFSVLKKALRDKEEFAPDFWFRNLSDILHRGRRFQECFLQYFKSGDTDVLEEAQSITPKVEDKKPPTSIEDFMFYIKLYSEVFYNLKILERLVKENNDLLHGYIDYQGLKQRQQAILKYG